MTKNTNNIIYEVEGSLALITINRPERKNALDSETLEMLNRAMDFAEEDNEIKISLKNLQKAKSGRRFLI